MNRLEPISKRPLGPIFAVVSSFYPQNIEYIPVRLHDEISLLSGVDQMWRYEKKLQMHVTFFTKSIEILKKFLIDKLH